MLRCLVALLNDIGARNVLSLSAEHREWKLHTSLAFMLQVSEQHRAFPCECVWGF